MHNVLIPYQYLHPVHRLVVFVVFVALIAGLVDLHH